ncbi:MAG: diaminopimelate epimerase [Eubacterium sp.]|nr:diaminopimelate epimerase [Eubacterium sp.]
MKFTKMHGLGNDYVYVNCLEETVENPSELARFVSDRHFGIGSDGLILIRPSEKADFQMDMYNADGSQAEMCGNGIRCVGKYVYDYGLTDKTEITIDTLAGIKNLKLTVENGKVSLIRVNMGSPILSSRQIPVLWEGETAVNIPVEIRGRQYHMTCVSMGNPHAVVFMDNVKELDIERIGPFFEMHPIFPKRTNTEFVEVLDRNTVNMRVWERGSGETLACGTGTCATVVACVLNNKTENDVTVHLLGGDLHIFWDREANQIYMTGPAEVVFDGELY